MKKIIALLSFSLFFVFLLCPHTSALSTSAQSAVVIDGDGGQIIYEKNAHTKRGMASTTKIMTALVALENCPLDREVKVADEAIGTEGSSIYLKHGEVLTMEQLLYALLLQSANDAAAAIAFEISGSIEAFSELMNKKGAELGLESTHFTNPHGLYDDGHYTTAYELALITKHALQNETFKKIVSTYKTTIPADGDNTARVLVNHNKLIKLYDGAVGVKTGFTKKTGRCLVSAAQKGETVIIAVTLNAPDDWNDHRAMLDLGFEKVETFRLAFPQQFVCNVPVVGGKESYVTVSNDGGLKYTCQKENAQITSEIILDRFLFAPVKKDDVIGQVIFYNQGKEIGRIDLTAENSVDRKQTKKKILGLF